MQANHYRPQAMVVFHTEQGNLVTRSTVNPGFDIDEDLISINTYRDMGADAPTFSINLTMKRNWHKWVASNDLVSIYLCRPPEHLNLVFMGLVDDCRKRTVVHEDSAQRVVTVTGRGVAKAFIQFDTGIVPEAEVAAPSIGWLVSTGVKLGGSNAQVILQSVWEKIAKKFINYKFDDGKYLFNLISPNFTARPGLIMMDDTSLVNWQGSLWSLIKEVAEAPFYECFWESDNTRPILTVRPTPFNKADWDKLPQIVIEDNEVVIEDVGRSDIETYTIFSVGAKSLFASNDPYKTFGTLPLWYEPYGKKYGIRRLHVSSIYTATADGKDINTSAGVMRKLQTDVFNWNVNNSSLYNGTLVLRGSNKYKVGSRLLVKSVEDNSTIEYYIKSVKQDFVCFESWTTEVSVIRGCEVSKRFAPPVGKATEYKGLGMVKYDPKSAKQALLDGTTPSSAMDSESVALASTVVQGAQDMLASNKIKYVSSGFDNSKGRMDCSSFTQYVYKTYANIDIGRTTGDQVTKGEKVDKSSLQPGDLVLFKDTYNSGYIYGCSHVGIYIGTNQFIHNSSSGGGLAVGNLLTQYWIDHWLTGRRIIVASALGQKIDKVFRGSLKGYGNVYSQMGVKYGVDAVVAAAISMQETGGTSLALTSKHNVGGMMDPKTDWMTLSSYDTITQGIEAHFKNLKWHASQGRITAQQLKPSYCPDGAPNDPNGLNNGWLPGVLSFIKQINNA